MQRPLSSTVSITFLIALASFGLGDEQGTISSASAKNSNADHEDVETRLTPLAKELADPKPGEWLFEHQEAGQTFDEYVASHPVRRSREWNTIHICVIGVITPEQKRIIDTTREYLEVFFDTPVETGKQVPLSEIPAHAQRKHPQWGGEQILSTYVLDDVLRPRRPDNALASLAFTASDLWPGKGWNFVFGQASLRDRTGVWSIHRNGDPGMNTESFQLCLRRTLSTASHETCHILSMPHCKQFECNLNGCNNRAEADRKPLHLCPICQRKLCWNLRTDLGTHLGKLEAFCRKHGFTEDAEWYRQAIEALQTTRD
ncbi:MAG TPA: archaemetzincin [Planctomycetaceae bacterium]|nr:archaemetzincin [Planctomycetaceae bacterium]